MTSTKREIHYTRDNTWTIPEIIVEFAINRKTVKRYIEEGKFPSPVKWNSDLGSRRARHFDRTEVTKVLGNFNPKRGELVYHSIQVTRGELDLIRSAARLVYLNPQEYITRVVTQHAERIINHTFQQEDDTF